MSDDPVDALFEPTDKLAAFRDKWVPLVRQVAFAEQDFDATFMPRFLCRACGPTNLVCSGEAGLVCVICQPQAAHAIFDQSNFRPV